MQELKNNLKKYFGFSEFKNGQSEIIQAVLNKQNTLAVMPTGGGKSLCYQLPAIILPGTAIVISPLIALMKDQSDALATHNIPVTYINSSINSEEFNQRIFLALNGNYKLIYIAPERLESSYFLSILNKINISFLAVDEAHCISQWGHDFRPSYLNISSALKNINISHILALTATATPEVQTDIIKSLKMVSPKLLVRGFDRPNLNYSSRKLSDKSNNIINILENTPEGSSIIYCGSRKKTDEFYNILSKKNIKTGCYHAGMTLLDRNSNQEKFISGETNIIVATNAFGMGIDRPDVRNVIHSSLTGSIESYYQEAGRAGRDGLEADCFLFYDYSDLKLQEYFIESAFPNIEEFKKVFMYLRDKKILSESENEIVLANKTGLPAAKISTIINHFERLKIIKKNINPQNLQILLNILPEELIIYSQQINEERKIVLEAILRSMTTESLKKFVSIDINYFSRKYDINKDILLKHLKALQLSGILKFNEPLAPNSITLSDEFITFEELLIDFDSLLARKNLANNKFTIMQEYAATKDCKRNFILNYFNDDSYTGTCNKCSSCKKKTVALHDLNNIDEITYFILLGAEELEGRFGRFLLSEYLIGEKSDKILQYSLNNKASFGAFKKYNFKKWNLISKIDEAIDSGLLLISKDQFPVITISIMGEKILKKNNIKFSLSSNNQINYPVNKTNEIAKTKIKTKKLSFQANNPDTNSLDTNNINKINNLFISGLSIDEVAKKMKISKGDVAQLLQNAIENNLNLNWKYYINQSTYKKIKSILIKSPYLLLKDIQKRLDPPIDFALLRITVAFIKKNKEIESDF